MQVNVTCVVCQCLLVRESLGLRWLAYLPCLYAMRGLVLRLVLKDEMLLSRRTRRNRWPVVITVPVTLTTAYRERASTTLIHSPADSFRDTACRDALSNRRICPPQWSNSRRPYRRRQSKTVRSTPRCWITQARVRCQRNRGGDGHERVREIHLCPLIYRYSEYLHGSGS